LLSLGAVAGLALVVRLHDYVLAPAAGDVPDERTYAVNLLNVFGIHPGSATLTADVLRRTSVALGVLTVVLAYSLARRLLPPVGALAVAFLIAVEPGLVILSRLALPEALLAPLVLWVILLCTPAVPETASQGSAGVGPAPEQAPSVLILVVLVALCVLAPFLRVTGLLLPLAAAGLLFSRGLRLQAGVITVAGAAGMWLGHQALSQEWMPAAGGGPLGTLGFISASIGPGRLMVDGWYLFGWLALAYLAGNAKRRHRYRALLWPVVGYAVIIGPLLPLGDSAAEGWYRLPIFPLLLVAGASSLYAAVREGQLLVPALALFTAGLWSLRWLFTFPWQPGTATLLLISAATLIPVAVAEIMPRGASRDVGQGVWAAMALAILAGDVILSWNLAIHLDHLG
jgi:hypothetical protein